MSQKKSPEGKRGFSSRHIQLLAIGGTIGTGLFLGSGRAIAFAGPGLILAYLITSLACFLLMRALGELLVARPGDRTFIVSIRRILGNRIAFVIGWAYWACWIALAMAEVTAIGIYVRWWLPACPQWLPGLLILAVLLLLNLASAGTFGEIEFWLALIKVVAILAVIVTAVIMSLADAHVHGATVGFGNLTHAGLLPHGWHGWLLSLQMAVFAYVGIESVGVSAAEADNPTKIIPKAVNGVSGWITALYCGSLSAIMMLFSWDKLNPAISPFVSVFNAIGVPGAASLVNFIVLMAAASACNGSLYTAGRMLQELSSELHRPALQGLSKVAANGVPKRAVIVSTILIAVATLLNGVMPSGVFTLVSSIATTSFLFIWAAIIASHWRWRRAGNVGSFKLPGGLVSDALVIAFLILVLAVLTMTHQTRVALVATLIWLVILSLASLSIRN